MPPTGLLNAADLAEATGRLFDRSTRLAGWGSGSVFDYFHGLYPLRLEYLVDNDPERWGTSRNGIPIVGPDRLVDEGADLFVVIYSAAWPEIQRQLARLGHHASVPASSLFVGAHVRSRLAEAEGLAARPRERRSPASGNAVVVQGPVLPDVTAHVLRVTTALHPDDRVILSTWHDTDATLLAEAARIVDDVVLSDAPAEAGLQNRNRLIVSTRAGIGHAVARGAHTILKTRTDLAVLSADVFARARWWLDRIGDTPAQRCGLERRVIVPSSFTRKYLLYHPSDMAMLGSAADLLSYWSAPLDPRRGDLLSPEWADQPLSQVNLAGNPNESYLGVEYCRTIGRPVEGTLADSWAFYRDLFSVVSNDWFELLWYKNLAMPDEALRGGVRELVSQQFWQRLQIESPPTAPGVDPDHLTLRALAGMAE